MTKKNSNIFTFNKQEATNVLCFAQKVTETIHQ